MSLPRCYLAGPITGLSFAGCTSWRERAVQLLAPDVLGISPMRGKEYLAHLPAIGGTPVEEYMANAISTPKAIVTRDRFDVRTADCVMMNLLGAQIVSIGTMIEAGWADAWRVPIVLVIEPGVQNVHAHAMLDQVSGYVVHTLEEAAHMVKVLLAGRSL